MPASKVEDVMTRSVVTLDPDETVHEAAKRLAHHRISGAPVVQEGKVVGVITESDIIRAALPPIPSEGGPAALEILTHADEVGHRPESKTVAEVMTTLVVEISPEDSTGKAAAEMERRGVNRLPVVDRDGTLVGIVARADLVRLMAERSV